MEIDFAGCTSRSRGRGSRLVSCSSENSKSRAERRGLAETTIFAENRDPEITYNMAIAQERLCTSMKLPSGDLTEDIIAVKIVTVVKEGVIQTKYMSGS
jgi:hypothetical protein